MGASTAPKQAKPVTAARRPETARPVATAWRRPADNAAEALSRLVPTASPVQPLLPISNRTDPEELEAESTSARVLRGVEPTAAVEAPAGPASPDGAPGGRPLPPRARRFMEPRFGTDFAGVRVHADSDAAQMSRAVDAHAFTTGRHIFFGENRFNPDTTEGRHLLAHELTHTIQQGAVPRGVSQVPVTRRAGLAVQRKSLFGTAWDWVKERAAEVAEKVPGFRMLTLAFGSNPITGKPVERTGANVMRAFVEIVPGGALMTKALRAYDVFEKAGQWLEHQVRLLAASGARLKDQLRHFVNSLRLSDVLRPGAVMGRLLRIFAEPAARLVTLVQGCASHLVAIVKQALSVSLARLARNMPGYDLLCAVLGADPFSGEKVPRNAETLIGGFLKLIGKEDVWHRCKEVKALPRLSAWWETTKGELEKLGHNLAAQGRATLSSLGWGDLLPPTRVFGKVLGFVGGCISSYCSWAGRALWDVLEIVFDVVAPGVLPYLKKTGAALRKILADPVPFGRNLSRAGQLGFKQFRENFVVHLRQGLIQWLTGMIGPDIYLPKAFEAREIFRFLLSVLNITWENVRAKLVDAVGEKAVAACEKGLDIVKTLMKTGLSGAWDMLRESVAKLKEILFDAVYDYVKNKLITKAVANLLALLNPVTAVIGAIVKIYNVIRFFVQRVRQIVQVGVAFINSLVDIAAGVIAPAANRVENALAGSLSLAINFLAAFLGLDDVALKVRQTIDRMRAPIDKALDRLVGWIVEKGRLLVKAGKEKTVAGARKLKELLLPQKTFTAGRERHTIEAVKERDDYTVYVHSQTRCPKDIVAAVRAEYFPHKSAEEDNPDLAQACRDVEDADRRFTSGTGSKQERYEILCQAVVRLYVELALLKKGYDANPAVLETGGKPPNTHWARISPLSFFTRLPGTAPRADIQGWASSKLEPRAPADLPEALSAKLKRLSRIRVHMVHHDLGGEGKAENLTPGSNSLNRRLQTIELDVYDEIKKNKHARFEYETEVTHDDKEGPLKVFPYIAQEVRVTVDKLTGKGSRTKRKPHSSLKLKNYDAGERKDIEDKYRALNKGK